MDCLDKKIDFEIVRSVYINNAKFHMEVRLSDLCTHCTTNRMKYDKIKSRMRRKANEYVLCAMAYYKRFDNKYEIFVENPARHFRRKEMKEKPFFQSVFTGILGEEEERQRRNRIHEKQTMLSRFGAPVSPHPSLDTNEWELDRSADVPGWLNSEDDIQSYTSFES